MTTVRPNVLWSAESSHGPTWGHKTIDGRVARTVFSAQHKTGLHFYIRVTVHRNRFVFKQPTRRTNYPNLFCYKTLHVSGIFSAHHQEFSTVHSALVSFMQVSDDRFQAESGCNAVPSWLCLESVIRNLHETYQCRMYGRELLMMGKEVDAVPSWLCLEAVIKACMKLTNAECTVENSSWWWAKKLTQFHPDSAWKRSSKPAWNLPMPNVQ